MTRWQRWLIVLGVLVVAAILAFPLRDTIFRTIVIPAAFITWNMNLFYRSFSQETWWWVVIFLVLFLLVFSLLTQPGFRPRTLLKRKPAQGPVEGFAIWLRKAEKGTYFKWLVANRLGKLAYQILLHRESGRPRSVFAPLQGQDWEPRRELQQYLETGLHGSFADFPSPSRLAAPQPTPLDLNVLEAVDFLESQVEHVHSPERH